MDKNTLYGLILIFLILIGFSWWSRPSEEERRAMQRRQDSLVQVELARKAALREQARNHNNVVQTSVGDTLFATDSLTTKKMITLENNKIKVGIDTEGGRIAYVELKEYVTSAGAPLVLWNEQHSTFGLKFENMREEIFTANLLFTPNTQQSVIEATTEPATLSMRLTSSPESYIEYQYSLAPDTYALDFNIVTNNMGRVIPGALAMEWSVDMPQLEKSAEFETRYTGIYYKIDGDDVDNLDMIKNEEEELTAQTKWIAFKNQFFSSILIAKESFNPATLQTEEFKEAGYLKKASATIPVSYNGEQHTELDMQFLFIPNNYYTLLEYGKEIDLPDLVNLGWSWLAWINRYIVIPLFSFLEKHVTSNYGLIILLMTLIIKLVLAPLTIKSYKSSAKMRLLKPQMDAINEKIPAEKAMERQQAMMELYRKNGVSPMGGCLPMLISFPFLIALFWFFPGAIELRQQSFLWADDLASYDSILDLPFSIPFYGDHVSLFCLLMAIVNVIYTWMNSKTQPQNDQMKMMKYMMYLMPIMFLFIFNNYSSGLSYYYFVSTLITILMTWAIRKFYIRDEKVLAEMAAAQHKPAAKKSSFQQRLIQMQKEQEKKLREQRERNAKRK